MSFVAHAAAYAWKKPVELATPAPAIVGAFGKLHDKAVIGDADLLDICYRFAGELVDMEQVLEQGWKSR